MPEAPVYEHRDPCPREDDVSPPPKSRDRRVVDPVPESATMEQTTDGQLGCRVATSLTRHLLTHAFG